MDRGIWVYDIETLASIFTYTAINIDTQKIVKYVIHKELNQIEDFMLHLHTECKAHVGFNNLAFDYPVLHYLIAGNNWKHLNRVGVENLISKIYLQAQRIIENANNKGRRYIVYDNNQIIKQIDLFKIWHFDNPARSTSLKALQISMNYPNVMEMPFEHDKTDITLEQINDVLEYNENDTLSTYEFYKKTLHKFQLRKDIKNKYKLPCSNYSDVKIGEKLLLKLYSELSDQDPDEIKHRRTYRESIVLKDCILDSISFKTPIFQKLLNDFKSVIITDTKKGFSTSVIYNSHKFEYGQGGIHSCIKPGIYNSDEEYIIYDLDVASLYPNIAIKNRFYPKHLGEEFVDVYAYIVKQRLQAKKAKDMSISDALKLSANGSFGKSNEQTSWLYDPQFAMSITCNGQLLLTMLIESLCESFECEILQSNTDGVTIKLHRKYIDDYFRVCKDWEEYTKLELEFVEYSKMVIRDVNNYLSVKTDGKVKYKGAFEITKEYHKDPSFSIVAKALSEYFVNGVPIEQTIKNPQTIYDYCGRQKFKSDSHGEANSIIYKNGLPSINVQKQQKNVRYYVSNKGSSFVKKYKSGDSEFINKGYLITVFNKYEEKPFEEYDINYDFYIAEAKKIINIIENKQLTLL